MSDSDRRPYPDGFDDDAIFADIVAHLNDDQEQAQKQAQDRAREQAQEPPSPPVAEDAARAAGTDIETTANAGEEAAAETIAGATDLTPGERTPQAPDHWPFNAPLGLATPDPDLPDQPASPAPQLWRAHDVDDDYEEHFEPPPVTPLPAGDLTFWAILAGMGGGPLLLLYLVFFNRDAGSYWILSAIALSVGGFALLVSRMPGHQEDDDDGARL